MSLTVRLDESKPSVNFSPYLGHTLSAHGSSISLDSWWGSFTKTVGFSKFHFASPRVRIISHTFHLTPGWWNFAHVALSRCVSSTSIAKSCLLVASPLQTCEFTPSTFQVVNYQLIHSLVLPCQRDMRGLATVALYSRLGDRFPSKIAPPAHFSKSWRWREYWIVEVHHVHPYTSPAADTVSAYNFFIDYFVSWAGLLPALRHHTRPSNLWGFVTSLHRTPFAHTSALLLEHRGTWAMENVSLTEAFNDNPFDVCSLPALFFAFFGMFEQTNMPWRYTFSKVEKLSPADRFERYGSCCGIFERTPFESTWTTSKVRGRGCYLIGYNYKEIITHSGHYSTLATSPWGF